MRWSSCVSPVHGFGNCLVEILHESLEFLDQVELGTEAASSHHATIDDAENDFDLVEPRTVFREVHKTDAMARIGKKRSARGHRLQNAFLSGGPQRR